MHICIYGLVLLATAASARGGADTTHLHSPALDAHLEAVAQQLEKRIIAPCCWRAPVADHDSPVARQIKREIRDALAEGRAPGQIKARYVARYGERILAVPPARGFNQFLWLIPALATIAGFGIAGHFIRAWRRGPDGVAAAPTKPSPASLSKVERQLEDWDE